MARVSAGAGLPRDARLQVPGREVARPGPSRAPWLRVPGRAIPPRPEVISSSAPLLAPGPGGDSGGQGTSAGSNPSHRRSTEPGTEGLCYSCLQAEPLPQDWGKQGVREAQWAPLLPQARETSVSCSSPGSGCPEREGRQAGKQGQLWTPGGLGIQEVLAQ